MKKLALICAGLLMGCALAGQTATAAPMAMATYTNAADAAMHQAAMARLAQSAERTGITILPIDQAKFWAGQHFDWEIEIVGQEKAPADIRVNGKPAAEFFGKPLERKQEDGYVSYRVNGVNFPKTGQFKVEVKAVTDQGVRSRMIQYKVVQEKAKHRAKNVILMVGDGMSLQIKEVARILSKGIYEGRYNGLLAMEQMPHMALVTTSGYDSLVTDSANSASAYNTGHKSVVNAMGVYENRTKDPLDDPRVENLNEMVQRSRGMSVGIITTAAVTDATPAAVSAHTRRRAEEGFIAADYLEKYHRPVVLMGGGAKQFIPLSTAGSKRKDNRDVISEFEKAGFQFAGTRKEMLAASSDKPLLGLFTMGHMNVYMDRQFRPNKEVLRAFDDQPNLIEMTAKALDILKKNPKGFYLMAEGACIDKQLHTMDWQRAAYDTIEFDQAVQYTRDWIKKNAPDTLLVVLADHAHGVSISGTYHEHDGRTGRDAVRTYASAGWPTFQDLNGDGFPDDPNADVTLAVQYANAPDHYENYRFQKKPTVPAITGQGGKIIANPFRAPKGARYVEGSLPQYKESQEVHSADDIIVMAEGPGSEYFKGVMDNTEIFFGMMRALGLDATKNVKK